MDNKIEENRQQIQAKLEEILGSSNVYFQPPETKKMEYPCFRYERVNGTHTYADNRTYRFTPQYEVTFISRDASPSIITDVVDSFQMVRYNRHFTVDNLHHDVFIIYK